jgi:hypothetical protein
MMQHFTLSTADTSVILPLFVTHSTTGAGLTGLVYDSANLKISYHRPGELSSFAGDMVDASLGTYTSRGFKEIDSSGFPGWYEFGLPADLTITVGRLALMLHGATNMSPCVVMLESNAGTIGDIRKIVQAQR